MTWKDNEPTDESDEKDENDIDDDIDGGCPVCGHDPCIGTQGGCCGESRGIDW